MAQFRKKPVVIEAIQYDGTEDGMRRVNAFLGLKRGRELECNWGHELPEGNPVWLELPCGPFDDEGGRPYEKAMPGDWIIKPSDGGHPFPCTPDDFAATYEPIEEPQETAHAR